MYGVVVCSYVLVACRRSWQECGWFSSVLSDFMSLLLADRPVTSCTSHAVDALLTLAYRCLAGTVAGFGLACRVDLLSYSTHPAHSHSRLSHRSISRSS